MLFVTIVGARPQFVKAAVVSRELRMLSNVEEVWIHTGQHYDQNMSQIFFDELDILSPAYNLGIGSETQGAQTGRMLEAIERILLDLKPDSVLVYGDTNSTLAGALAAVKLHIPLAHVEAGLRSYNRFMPEELNRVLTDHAANLLFAPTDTAVQNLTREGIPRQKVHLVGDVMYDAALYYAAKAGQTSFILQRLNLQPKDYILATVHRAENTDNQERLRAIFDGLGRVAKRVPIILPLHPRTRAALEHMDALQQRNPNLHVIEPVGYLDMVLLERNACLITTDSGGVQKEAFFYHVPCVTLRTETEWPELVELGWNHLVPPSSANCIYEGVCLALGKTGLRGEPYGNGQAAKKIVQRLTIHLVDQR
jgi:UDP-GlcNAc3NAcA epimerase